MTQSARWLETDGYEAAAEEPSRRLPFLKFLMRYPIFILAFGPPIFRSNTGIDVTKGNIDIWAFLQVVLISSIATRAIWRLVAARSILMPKQIRSILKLAFFLGGLYLASVAYSPSRFTSAAYSILYFLSWICVAEFVVDVYKNPPDWIQSLFHLRLIALLLSAVVVLTLFFDPEIVMAVFPGFGIRLLGGAVAPIAVICPVIAVISAYAFLHSLESRVRSSTLFLVGLAGSVSTQTRGCEVALLLSLFILALGWAKSSRRAMLLFIPSFIASILLLGAILGSLGGERIWNLVNRGQDAQGIATGSGRTQVWHFVYQYCLAHPQGMGYVAGFRILFRQYYTLDLIVNPQGIGNAHNSFVQVLADAGWLAFAVYLIMLVKILAIGWRFTGKKGYLKSAPDSVSSKAMECSLLLLIFCLAEGMDTAAYSVPLMATFYWQNIIIAIILGISARMIASSRTSYISSAE